MNMPIITKLLLDKGCSLLHCTISYLSSYIIIVFRKRSEKKNKQNINKYKSYINISVFLNLPQKELDNIL